MNPFTGSPPSIQSLPQPTLYRVTSGGGLGKDWGVTIARGVRYDAAVQLAVAAVGAGRYEIKIEVEPAQ